MGLEMPTCYICGQDATTIDHVPPLSVIGV